MVEITQLILLELQESYPFVEVLTAPMDTEADSLIVDYCRSNAEAVAAVLSDDNDFLLLPFPCPVVRLGTVNWEHAFEQRAALEGTVVSDVKYFSASLALSSLTTAVWKLLPPHRPHPRSQMDLDRRAPPPGMG